MKPRVHPNQGKASKSEGTGERIIQAAAQLIAQKGYDGSTTREIARIAGVNEVTIFRRFGSKKNLFMEVVYRFSAQPELEEALKDQLTGDYRQDLIQLGGNFLEMMNKHRGSILMSMCEAQRFPEVRDVIAQSPMGQSKLLGKYLRQQNRLGVVRELSNPELVAQAFFGMLFEYSLSEMITACKTPSVSYEDVVAQMVDLFIHGTIKQTPKSE